MSRTDKDLPHHVTATWWEPSHHNCEHDPSTWLRAARHWYVCDLPDEPRIIHRSTTRIGIRPLSDAEWHCEWIPVRNRRDWHGWAPPPRWYINHRYHAPERTRARADRQRMLAEHRATGTVDHIPVPRQGRHTGHWDWC